MEDRQDQQPGHDAEGMPNDALEDLWNEAIRAEFLEDLAAFYVEVSQDDQQRVVSALKTLLRMPEDYEAQFEYKYVFTFARTFSKGGPVEPDVDHHWDAVMMFRDGIIALVECNGNRVDWRSEADVWHEFVLACEKVQLPINCNAFTVAVVEANRRQIKVSIDSSLTRKHVESIIRQLEQLIAVAYVLQEWRGDENIYLPVAMIGSHIVGKAQQLGRSAGSRLMESLRSMGILVCTDSTFSQAGKKAKGHRLNPSTAGLYTVVYEQGAFKANTD